MEQLLSKVTVEFKVPSLGAYFLSLCGRVQARVQLLFLSFFYAVVSPITTTLGKERLYNEDSARHEVTEFERTLNVMILTLPAIGHVNPALAVGEELVRRGHNVTFVMTTFPTTENGTVEKVKVRGMTYLSAGESAMLSAVAMRKDYAAVSNMFTVAKEVVTVMPLELTIFARFLDKYLTTNTVDVLVGGDYLQALILCFGQQRNIKVVVLGTTLQYQPHTLPPWPWPGMIAGSISDNLTFLQRLKLALTSAIFHSFFRNIFVGYMLESIQAYCPSVTLTQAATAPGVYIPQIVPSAIGFDYPRTISPLTTYVGPLLTRDPDPISTDLQEWLDSKKEQSVIFVSMGSYMILTKEKGDAILNGVLATGYSLLWSLRESNRDILEGVELDDKQVRILSWAPQLAVLGHRAIRMAIVHGGTNGIHESLYNGVPLIVLPINGDQMSNAGRVHHQGLGIHLQDCDVTESSVFETIKQIDKGAYRENVQRLKKIFVDGGGRERAAELIEFYCDVGYSHLVPSYAKYDWSWVQYYNADVYLIVTLVLLFVSYLSVKCCRCVCKSILSRRFSKEKSD